MEKRYFTHYFKDFKKLEEKQKAHRLANISEKDLDRMRASKQARFKPEARYQEGDRVNYHSYIVNGSGSTSRNDCLVLDVLDKENCIYIIRFDGRPRVVMDCNIDEADKAAREEMSKDGWFFCVLEYLERS